MRIAIIRIIFIASLITVAITRNMNSKHLEHFWCWYWCSKFAIMRLGIKYVFVISIIGIITLSSNIIYFCYFNLHHRGFANTCFLWVSYENGHIIILIAILIVLLSSSSSSSSITITIIVTVIEHEPTPLARWELWYTRLDRYAENTLWPMNFDIVLLDYNFY